MSYCMRVVDESGNRVEKGENTHLDRNLAGGLHLARTLVQHGMGYWPTEDDTPYPKVNSHKWIDDELVVIDAEAAQVLYAYLKDTRVAEPEPGISVYKLCGTNDGWWVTKEECESALAIWEEAGRPEVDSVSDVTPFLRVAAENAGFRVG